MSKFPAPLKSVTFHSAYNKQTECTDPTQLLAALSSNSAAYAIELRLHGVPDPMSMTRTDGLACLLKMLLEQKLVEADPFDARASLRPRYMQSPRHMLVRPRATAPSFGANRDAKSAEVRDKTLAVLFDAVAKFNAYTQQLTLPEQPEQPEQSASEEVRLAESAKLRAELAEKLGAKVAEAAELRAKLAEATEIAEVEANNYW